MLRRQFITIASGTLLLGCDKSDRESAALDGKTQAPLDLNAAMAKVCDLVIPTTQTPGAQSLGCAQWVIKAAANGTLGLATNAIEEFYQVLASNTDFLITTPENQHTILSIIDEKAYNGGGDRLSQLWVKIKTLVLTSYYSSEVGASQELHYELVPGRFLPDTKIDSTTKAWANDWTAVDFG